MPAIYPDGIRPRFDPPVASPANNPAPLDESPIPQPLTAEQKTDAAAKAYNDALKARDKAMSDAPLNMGVRSEVWEQQAVLVAQAKKTLDAAIDAEIAGKISQVNDGIPSQYQTSEDKLVQQFGKQIQQRIGGDARNEAGDERVDYGVQRKADRLIPSFSDDVPVNERIEALKLALKDQPVEVVERVLQDPRVQQMVKSAAEWVRQGYDDTGGSDVFKAAEAAQRLGDLTEGLPPEMAAQIVQQCLPTIGKITHAPMLYTGDPIKTPLGPYANLSRVVESLADGPQADTLKQQIAKDYLDNEDVKYGGVTLNNIKITGEGVSPALSIEIAQQLLASGKTDEARDFMKNLVAGMDIYKDKVVQDTEEYAKQAAELSWFVKNLGPGMTPAQRDNAIQDYISGKSPEWKQQLDDAAAKLVEDGNRLEVMTALFHDMPPELRAIAPDAQKQLDGLIKDETIRNAMEFALARDPGKLSEEESESLLNLVAENVEKGNISREFAGHLFQRWLTGHLLQKLPGFDPGSPASRFAVTSALNELRDSRWAKLLGVTEENLGKAVDIIEESLARPGESPALVEARLRSLDANLGRVQGFGEGTTAGNLFRFLGVAAAGVGFLNSTNKELTDPSAQNTLSLFSSSAGLTKYGVDFGKAIGVLGEEGLLAGGPTSVFLSAAAAVGDVWQAGSAFADGDAVEGVLSGLRAGATFALFAAEDPWIGIPAAIIWGIATLGLGAHEHSEESKQYEPDHNDGRTVDFLRHAGLSNEAATALSDQSGDGYSPYSLLVRYAELKGYNFDDPKQQQKFADWINGLGPQQLANVRDVLHQTLDDYGGEVGKLGSDKTVPNIEYDVNPSTGQAIPKITVFEAHTVGEIDALCIEYGSVMSTGLPPP